MLSSCVLGVVFCESVDVGGVANVLFCRGFAVWCGVDVVFALFTSTGSIPAASTILKKCNYLLFKGFVLSCSAPTAWRYNLGRFGAQKFSYVLHYLCQAPLSNPPIHTFMVSSSVP